MGLKEEWEDECNIRKIKKKLAKGIKLKQKKEWEKEVDSKTSLELVGRLGYEENGQCYVKNFDKKLRRVYSKFRLGNYIWEGVKRPDGTRVCSLCNGQENYSHILNECVVLEEKRNLHLPDIKEKNIFLLNTQNRKDVKKIITFLNECYKLRSQKIEPCFRYN